MTSWLISPRWQRSTPWLEAAIAIVEGELIRAADLYLEIGNFVNEAYTRLRAAEKLRAEGRGADADRQLEQALALWRSVGATRYIREGDALLASAIERTSTNR